MGVIFEPFSAGSCCLCGSSDNLTGEHKVKAAPLRSMFGQERMAIGNLEDGKPLRIVQGPKSKALHFKAKICGHCNSTSTQPADRAFDQFHDLVRNLILSGHDPASVFDDPEYALGSDRYLNVFRYFAKIVCCQLAESDGPRPIEISNFARGLTRSNNISLHIDLDPTYDEYARLSGDHAYAAHGGLMVVSNRKTGLPTSFRTYLSYGPVRYIFYIRFGLAVALALKLAHPKFSKKCRDAYLAALKNPISPELQRQLGV